MAETNGNTQSNSPGASQAQAQHQSITTTTSPPPPPPLLPPTPAATGTQFYTSGNAPRTSLTDSGASPRPRDARTIHMVLTSLGVTAYQERVPLQLLDFAYRYTSSVLSDAAHFSAEGYVASSTKGSAGAADGGNISIQALRLAASSRPGYQFTSVLPKETMLELAAERNRIKLPAVDKDVHFGVRLPHERFVLTGTGWGLPEEWDSEGEMDEDMPGGADGEETKQIEGAETNGETHAEEEEDKIDEDMEDGQDGFEQVFGRDNEDEDNLMEDG